MIRLKNLKNPLADPYSNMPVLDFVVSWNSESELELCTSMPFEKVNRLASDHVMYTLGQYYSQTEQFRWGGYNKCGEPVYVQDNIAREAAEKGLRKRGYLKSALFNPNWPVRKIKPNANYEPGCLPVDTKDPVELMFQKQRDEFSAKSAANRLSEWTKSY